MINRKVAMARPRKMRRLTKATLSASARSYSSDSLEQHGFQATPPPEGEGIDSSGGDAGDAGDAGDGNFLGQSGRNGIPIRRAKRPYVPIASRAGQCRGFYIARVIPHTSKAGDPADSPQYVDFENAAFTVQTGDFVLVLSPPATMRVRVRNYRGQEGQLPRRMLQDLYNPWAIPANIRLDDVRGIPFPLRFTRDALSQLEGDGTEFAEDEPVMVMRTSRNPGFREVLDFERMPGSVRAADLRTRFVVPWNLRVDRQAFEDRFRLRSARAPRRSSRVLGDEVADDERLDEEVVKKGDPRAEDESETEEEGQQ